MARAEDTEVIDLFEEFYRNYYKNEIGDLAQKYPNERKSLYVDWQELYRFDPDLADDVRNHPEQFQDYAEEALRLYDLPVDVKLGQAHVRIKNLPETTEIRQIRADHRGMLISVQGIVRKATDVRPKVTTAAFECQRCGTLTRIPQTTSDFQEPHECQGCERQGPFRINYDQSEFVDAQKLRVQESPEGLRGGETPQSIDVNIEDDITGEVTAGDHVRVAGVLKLDQQGQGNEKSPMFDVYMDGHSVEIEDEQFEDMNITDEDKKEIVALSEEDDIYEKMIESIAPSIYGYERAKMAMILQLFSGVTKHLPDGSRIRGDLHMLLIGDPGTGKCLSGNEQIRLADGSTVEIGDLVDSHLDDPRPIDDGVYDEVSISLPTVRPDGKVVPGTATKVWKREAPAEMYRVGVSNGSTLEITPSHPLFIDHGGRLEATRADELETGERVAIAPDAVVADGGVTTDSSNDASSTVHWSRIESIDVVEPDYDWVYDLEVPGTHSYISEGIVSHNSQMLQYIREIAPRSVYTSGKGSSSAGLCVTGDTFVHTSDGFREIRDIATAELPESVETETAVEKPIDMQTFNREEGRITEKASSHVWRMPEKPCRRIETSHGKELEASVNTPLLICGEQGIEWREIADIEAGDYVAAPRYEDIERRTVSVRDYLELTNEKVELTDESVEFLRERLCEEFGHLRAAANELNLSECFIYDSLPNRHVPLSKLDTMLNGIGATREEVAFDRVMPRHGDSITIPDEFDADLLYLLGLVFGDGDISLDRRDGNRGLVRISNGNERLLERAADIFAEKFDKHPEIERQDDRVPCIRVNSATIARLFANAGMQTPKADLALDPGLTTAEYIDAFLRGLMDADGSVSARTNGGSSILISTISERLATQIQLLLETYGIRARTRERDRRGETELDDGRIIESKHVQYFVELHGADIERYAAEIGFECAEKQAALETIVGDARRRGETIPVGNVLASADGPAGQFHTNLVRGDNPGRSRARTILDDRDLGAIEPLVREAVEADLRWDEVVAAVDTAEKEVFDLTVPETHNFVGNGIVTHNTAAAVRDDFGEGQQWTLEAGALVLADQGIAAVDELDKMRCVTGDTLVHLGDGCISRIRDLAHEGAADGTIEQLANGRTIRDVNYEAWTMTEDGQLVRRPVTAIHEYDAPTELTRVRLQSGETLTATHDHPFFVFEDGERVEKPASDLDNDDWVYVPKDEMSVSTDGGSVHLSARDAGEDVECVQVADVRTVDGSETDCVYDLTVDGTHNFVANGMVVHNSEDRSAMHEALEQQSISVSKAGINATLKSRCSLLGAANPKYGRFDQYEPIAEQIDLEPALISRFDLIFTVTDKPNEDEDRNLAEHILTTNYAGELNTHREQTNASDYTEEEVARVTDEVAPTIDSELLRKYIAYSKRNVFPTMTEEAKETIREFYVDLRSQGTDEDAPVPVTARKLEALVRLAEASARIRLADTVEMEDAERVIDIVQSTLESIGMDPETGELDADVIETGTSKSQRDRIKNLKTLIGEIEDEYDEGAPVERVLERAEEAGMERSKVEHEIEKLKQQGEVYEPSHDHLRTT
ncbi:MAG: LAGLIDADG family homing endonuclease [Halorientalis sp.]